MVILVGIKTEITGQIKIFDFGFSVYLVGSQLIFYNFSSVVGFKCLVFAFLFFFVLSI